MKAKRSHTLQLSLLSLWSLTTKSVKPTEANNHSNSYEAHTAAHMTQVQTYSSSNSSINLFLISSCEGQGWSTVIFFFCFAMTLILSQSLIQSSCHKISCVPPYLFHWHLTDSSGKSLTNCPSVQLRSIKQLQIFWTQHSTFKLVN